jgi:hypothetical protein
MLATPFEQVVLAVAVKLTGEPMLLPALGEVTVTPDPPLPLTVMVIGVVAAPPQ